MPQAPMNSPRGDAATDPHNWRKSMSRIPTPPSIEASPAASQPGLRAVEKQLGSVPNLFRLVGTSPAALEGYLSLSGALGRGALAAATRERIALAVAEI